MKFSVAVGFLLAPSVLSHGGHHHHHHGSVTSGEVATQDHNSLRPHTHVAFHHVETACAQDVLDFCTPQQPRQPPMTLGDPFLDWMFVPLAPPPPMRNLEQPSNEMDEISAIMDRMFDSFFQMPSDMPIITITYESYRVPIQKEQPPKAIEEPPKKPEEKQMQDINFMVDSTAGKLASETSIEEMPQLAEKLQTYGQELMQKEGEDSLKHHVGRRLTEMDCHKLKQHRMLLPFGEKNACLKNAFSLGKVSPGCSRSIQELQMVAQLEKELEHRHDTVMNLMSVYLGLLVVVLVLICRRARQAKLRRKLGHRILQTIYSNPILKQQVESELGESLGHIPPMPFLALKLISAGGRDLKKSLRCMKRLHYLFLCILMILVVVAPMTVLPLCIAITLVRIFHLCLFKDDASTRECECCCCGATTTTARLGVLSPAQECCSCCNGTGVCAPACTDCCKEDGCACCNCGDNCCCKEMICVMRDGCSCCCCGATPDQAKAGLLTEEQACCNCCKGTGTCSDACKSCCGGGGCCCCCNGCCDAPKKTKGQGQKHKFESEQAVYHGIPVQIV